jgi:predicted DNA-binding antitoxin AbrB/MazE fold protein
MKTIHAVFENGVFRPTVRVELPDYCEVEFEPRVVGKPDDPAHQERVRALLARRFASGQKDIAARHNEHQP